jgi:hypothetical protein
MNYELDIPPVKIGLEQRAELMGGDVCEAGNSEAIL